MFKYLSAAFVASPILPGLGKVPVNLLMIVVLVALGFWHPGFWLACAGLEVLYLCLLTSNARFRRLVDSVKKAPRQEIDIEAKRRQLTMELPGVDRQQLFSLEDKCVRIMRILRANHADDLVIEDHRQALPKLTWIYLKLLIARHNFFLANKEATSDGLQHEIARLEKEIAEPAITPTLKESKTATLAILKQRVENLDRRETALEEIESDMKRIEAQIDLTLENVRMCQYSGAAGMNISLASHLLDGGYFGAAEAAVADLDHAFSNTTPPTTGQYER